MKTYEIVILTLTGIFAVWYLLKGFLFVYRQEPDPDEDRKNRIFGVVLPVLAMIEYLIFSKGA